MAFPLALLLPILAEVGAPLLKKVITRSAGEATGEVAGAAIDMIASRLGVQSTPEAIAGAYSADPDRTADVIRRVEWEHREDWATMLAEVNQTMRAEGQSKSLLQRIWRPIFGLVYALAFAALALALVRALWRGDTATINALAGISGFLIAFYGMGASVLGVYVWQRSAEKRAGAA